MFRKSQPAPQFGIFSSPSSLLSGKTKNHYEDPQGWHNIFRKQVTMRINENLFSELFCSNNGTPNASIRVMIAMMVLKEAQGVSDQKLFEDCRFNMLIRSALGLVNIDDELPVESTYYLFRKRIHDFEKAGNENLFEKAFAEITKNQGIDFEVSGKRVRMDSKLLGSNIAWLSRYELVHETLRLFYKEIKELNKLDIATVEKLDTLLKIEGNKIVYTHTSDEVKIKLQTLGALIYQILPVFSLSKGKRYETLKRVFDEQFIVDENKIVISRTKEEISAKSVQSPHDTDCHYRNKDGNQVKGYSINVTESCDDEGLNLIGNVDVRVASTPDTDFLQDDLKKTEAVFTGKIEAAHTDGAYHSPDNQKFCKDNNINLYLHAMQGAKGRYAFSLMDDGELAVLDTKTNKTIIVTKIFGKNNITRWRIDTSKGHRYFTQQEIDSYLIRKQIENTPIEVLQKRNNVEATIFQLGYHYSNDKSRYRGLIKHKMWANIRCLWVNFVRILKYIKQICQRTTFLTKNALFCLILKLKFALKIFLSAIVPNNQSFSENQLFSLI
jgi:hypothetical protein